VRKVIYSVLGMIIRQHTILSTIVIDEVTSTPCFVRVPTIDLDKCVTFVCRQRPQVPAGAQDGKLDDILEEQHNADFKEDFGKRPFWRLIVLTEAGNDAEFVTSFVFHHAIGDGSSGLAFHRTFFSARSAIPGIKRLLSQETGESNVLIESPRDALIPGLESLHKLLQSIFFILNAV
jgi:hypothetical protein